MTALPIVAAALLFSATVPEAGQTAPDFTARTTEGKTVTLSELVKKGTVVVAFFPKAFTPGCTRQMEAFRDRWSELEKKGALVLGVSMDDQETLARFKKELGAQFPFVPDPDGKIARAFGAAKEGDKYASRYNFVIGEGRKILTVESGMSAVNPDEAVAACPMPKK